MDVHTMPEWIESGAHAKCLKCGTTEEHMDPHDLYLEDFVEAHEHCGQDQA